MMTTKKPEPTEVGWSDAVTSNVEARVDHWPVTGLQMMAGDK
jgi:hypothetical protein